MNKTALVVGAGSIGTRRIRHLIELGFEVGICESNQERKTAAEKLFPKCTTFPSIEAALTLGDYAVGLICTLPSSHVELAILAANAGMNLFIEKPLSNYFEPEKLRELVFALQNNGLWAKMGFSYRHLESLREFNRALGGGIIAADFWAGQYLSEWGSFTKYYTSKEDGGVIRDSLSHSIDLVHWMCGKIERVTSVVGSSGTFGKSISDTATVLCEMENGAVTVHADYFQNPRSNKIEILSSSTKFPNHFSWSFDPVEAEDMYRREMKSLAHWVEKGMQGQPDLAQGILNLEVLDAIVLSNKDRRSVQIENRWKEITGRK